MPRAPVEHISLTDRDDGLPEDDARDGVDVGDALHRKILAMLHVFPPEVVDAILQHMNADHRDDNLLIVRAFADRAATSAEMVGFDGDGGTWRFDVGSGRVAETTIPWPGGPISDRPAVRREVVALYDAACGRLGIAPRSHD